MEENRIKVVRLSLNVLETRAIQHFIALSTEPYKEFNGSQHKRLPHNDYFWMEQTYKHQGAELA